MADEVCRNFLQGRCRFDDCKFSHPDGQGKMVPPSTDESGKEICRKFLRGICSFNDCIFSHPEKYAPPPPAPDTMELCRKFKRGLCHFNDCKFAHAPDHVQVGSDNHVKICKDYNLGKCHRENLREPCRYYHLPPHLMPPECRGLAQQNGFGPRFAGYAGLPPEWARMLPIGGQSAATHVGDRSSRSAAAPTAPRSGRPAHTQYIEVCRDFKSRRVCSRDDCRFAHVEQSGVKASEDGLVTICFDFIKGKCARENMKEPCRFFHPPDHLQSLIEKGEHVTARVSSHVSSSAAGSPAPEALAAYASMMYNPYGDYATDPYLASLGMAGAYAQGGVGAAYCQAQAAGGPAAGTAPTHTYPSGGAASFRGPSGGSIPVELEVCQNFLRGNCRFDDCNYAHVPPECKFDRNRNKVKVCVDFARGKCNREHLPEPCRFYHLPPHLLDKFSSGSGGARAGQKRALSEDGGSRSTKARTE